MVYVSICFDFEIYFLSVMNLLSTGPCQIVPLAICITSLIWNYNLVNAQRDKTLNCGGKISLLIVVYK